MIDIESVPGYPRVWLKQSHIPAKHHRSRLTDIDLTGYEVAMVAKLLAWRDSVSTGDVIGTTGKGLLLQGLPGQGKTTLGCVLLNEIVMRSPVAVFQPDESKPTPYRPVYYTTYPGLLRAQRRLMNLDEGDEWLKLTRITEGVFGEHAATPWNVSVLMLDDIGKEHTTHTGWAEHLFDELLRARFDQGLPTIITTNTPLDREADEDDWESAYGPAMASFAHEAFDVISVHNSHGDQRRTK